MSGLISIYPLPLPNTFVLASFNYELYFCSKHFLILFLLPRVFLGFVLRYLLFPLSVCLSIIPSLHAGWNKNNNEKKKEQKRGKGIATVHFFLELKKKKRDPLRGDFNKHNLL